MAWNNHSIRYICIDLGDKRTGLALSDSLTRIVTPLKVLEVPITSNGGESLLDSLCSEIAALAGPSEIVIVVGLPLVQQGKEGPRAKLVRAFIQRLQARLAAWSALPPTRAASSPPSIRFQDETLSTAEADWSMARSGMTRGEKKSRRDALAAAVILREFLANNSACQAPCQEPGVPTGPSHLQSPGLALPDQPNQPS